MGYAQVALERGIDLTATGLTYAVPQSLHDLEPGQRVRVPLGRRDKPAFGYVIERNDSTVLEHVKPIIARDEHAISFTPDLLQLARWISAYYCCPLGMTLANMLPAAVKRGTGTVHHLMVRLPPTGTPTPSGGGTSTNSPSNNKKNQPKLTPLQREAMRVLQERTGTDSPWIEVRELANEAGARTLNPVKRLIDLGLVEAKRAAVVRAAVDEALAQSELKPVEYELTAPQRRAFDRIADSIAQGFCVHLLHGVTGSGKTEVYLRLIERVLEESGQVATSAPPHSATSALVLVPEIALTPQMVRSFVERFGPSLIAVLHSGLTPAQRHEQWRRIREGEARIVIGARSAVFAPFAPEQLPGVVIVDEEHDSSYKQDQLPRYHARDVAIKRAQLLNIPVVLGSATPSLESYHNATVRRTYHLLELPDRVAGLQLPTVQLVNMLDQRKRRYQMTGKAGVHLLSIELEHQLRQTLEAGGQAMLLLNRRGYANYIACPDHACGYMKQCDQCDATMVYHKDARLPAGGFIRCHHCLAEQLLPATCPDCGKRITVFGLGTQRVEEELQGKLPGVKLARMDSDTMRTGRDYHETLERFRKGDLQLLVGTQMIAKGLDFPNVQLVGVISGDTALHMPDFRAAERTFQLIAQVAGRSGRSSKGGRVIVQTFSPDDPAIVLAARHDYVGFATRELQVRESVGLPPTTRMARIVIRDKDLPTCIAKARELVTHLSETNQRLDLNVRLRGPSACPIARIANFHRQQIELIGPPPANEAAARIQKLLTALRNARLLISDAHTAVDVDPVALL